MIRIKPQPDVQFVELLLLVLFGGGLFLFLLGKFLEPILGK